MIIDGILVAKEVMEEVKERLKKFSGRSPCLAVIRVGDNPASQIYVMRKIKACGEVGITSKDFHFPEDFKESELIKVISQLNGDETVDGILVQLPLPQHIDALKVVESLDPSKDVDGFHPINVGKMLMGSDEGYLPCTPLGIQVLLDRYEIPVEGKHVVIVGRSNVVGKPMAAILMQNKKGCNATVTVLHSHSERFQEIVRSADILIVAVGKAQFIKGEMVKEGATVIDVGVNRKEDGKLVGDVDFDALESKCSYITPVPGGVGPMTIAMLLKNTLKSYLRRVSSKDS